MMFYICLFVITLSSVQCCDMICDEETHESPICGSDGVEYKTRCDFTNAVCIASRTGDQLHMTNYGPCVTLNTTCSVALRGHCIHQSTINMDEAIMICATDKTTYDNPCFFRKAQCQHQQAIGAPQISVDHMGKCPIDTSTLIQINCSQYFTTANVALESGDIVPHANCDKVAAPVCATSTVSGRTYNRTFGNECMFCQHEMSRHKISSTNMVAYLTHRTACPHTGLIG